jgi:hypothetical protein
MLGQHNLSQKKKREKEKRNKCRHQQINKTKMTHHHCALRRIPTMLLAQRSTVYQATHLGRKATTMKLLPGLVLGFPRYIVQSGIGVHPMPFRKEDGTRMYHCINVGQADRDFSQPPKNHHPR